MTDDFGKKPTHRVKCTVAATAINRAERRKGTSEVCNRPQ
jgi:hypothetical protein